MRIVTFNVHHGTVGADGVVDGERLGEVCAGLDADVLALQEIERGVARSGRADLPAMVAEATGMAAHFDPVVRTGGGQYGNALLVRGSLLRTDTRRLHRPLLRLGRERRGSIAARVHVERDDVELWVVATHLGVHADEVDRQLAAVVRLAVSLPAPKVLLGDLNRRPHHVEAAAAGTGLTVADLAVDTYPSDRPRIRIDHVLVEGLDIVSVSAPEAPVSDHRPLVVDTAPARRPHPTPPPPR